MKYFFLITLLFYYTSVYAKWEGVVDQVALHSMKMKDAKKRKWDWEDAVFLYGLSEYGKSHSNSTIKNQIYDYLKSYQSYWQKKGLPEIDRSDACPSSLTALTLATDWNDPNYLSNIEPVQYYLKNEPRNTLGTINHLGHSWLRFFYPASIWVDSLMMIGVLSSNLGGFNQDASMLEFAANQPNIFAEKLQDPSSGLFRHAWYEKSNRVVPSKEGYWLRGNGWALVSLVKIIEQMKKDHPLYYKNVMIFKKLALSLMNHQRKNGFWGTLVNYNSAYDETSGTALVGYGLARGYRLGLLGKEALSSAQKAFAATLSKVKKTRKGYSLRGISAATNPGPALSYLIIPKIADKGYGVGPFLMLASELELTKENL
jgi:unsaturated rhamnogalacturonyl hydrolase